MKNDLLKLNRYTRTELIEYLSKFENLKLEPLKIENENIEVTPKDEVKDYTNMKINPFDKNIYTNEGIVYSNVSDKIEFFIDEYLFLGRVWKLRKEYEKNPFYVVEATARIYFNLFAYSVKDIKINDFYVPSIIKEEKDYEEEVFSTITLDDYLNGKKKQKGHFYFESTADLETKEFVADFENRKSYYHNAEFDSILFAEENNYIGILKNELSKELLDEILIKDYEYIYIQDTEDRFYSLLKMNAEVPVYEEFLEENGINYKGICYMLNSYGNKDSSRKIITSEKIISYIKENYNIKRLFIRR